MIAQTIISMKYENKTRRRVKRNMTEFNVSRPHNKIQTNFPTIVYKQTTNI